MSASHGAARRHPLHVHLTVLFSGLMLLSGAALTWIGYQGNRATALAGSERQFAGVARETGAHLSAQLQPGARMVDLLAQHPVAAARSLAEHTRALPALATAVQGRAFVAVYVGHADGSFFLLRPLRDRGARVSLGAPAGAEYLIDSIDAGSDKAQRLFLNAALAEIGRGVRDGGRFDPRTRPWYRDAAAAADRRILSAPYRFATGGAAGITIARRSASGSVVGLDVTLDEVGRLLAELRTLPGASAVLFDGRRRVLASTGDPAGESAVAGAALELPPLEALTDAAQAPLATLAFPAPGAAGAASRIEVAGREWQRMVVAIPTERELLALGMAIPLDELLVEARTIRDRTLLATLVVLLLALPLTYALARRVSRALDALAAEANDIRAFRFDGPSAGRSPVLEVDQLSAAMDRMRETIRRFLDLATSLAAERRFPALLERVAHETANAVGADGAAIYLPAPDDQALARASCVGTAAASVAEPTRVALDAGSPVAAAYRTRRTILAPLAGATAAAIPLANRAGEGVGVLVLALREATPAKAQLAFAQALSATAAIAIETQRLLEDRKALLDALIRLLAGAIDAKSPYTGGHCQRVPELTAMLARAACDATEGPLADFTLDDEQWEALQIASWLHDCGKVTTPEYVVDKATKLETLYDRIHEVRMRFEVAKREAEVAAWRRIAEGAPRDAGLARLAAEHAALDDDFRFVAGCNKGGEFLDAAKIARLRSIAQRQWMRTLDDRIGISHDERRRKERRPASALPVAEPLLADKPEHRIERAPGGALPADNHWGFRMKVPELQYDRGELVNLAIARGTLTEEERYVINHHIVQTIVLLSQLPLPRHLREVPAIAGAHHEKMDGSGYPRGLKREQMSWVARMIAIADIFEALTAADRPYKRGKTLAEALAIMGRMCREQHVDPDLFELFVGSGVYQRYAERFLAAEQIDGLDLRTVLPGLVAGQERASLQAGCVGGDRALSDGRERRGPAR